MSNDNATETEAEMKKRLWWAKHWGLFIGIPFTILVVGLIVYGNLSTSEHQHNFEWEYRPDLYICDTAPEWAQTMSEDIHKADGWWADQGFAFNNIKGGPCPNTCTFMDPDLKKERTVACNKGMVTLDLRDQWFSEDHAGECIRPKDKTVLRDVDWTTILLPSIIFGSDDIDAEMLPLDVNSQTIGHEIGHCLVGIGHNLGPSLGCGGGCRLNSKTGAMMNPTIYGGGWVNEALPPAPPEWD
jgi:hypothetical protein